MILRLFAEDNSYCIIVRHENYEDNEREKTVTILTNFNNMKASNET